MQPESPTPTASEAGADAAPEAEIRPWWRRSPVLASCAALAIGLATLWFANMLGRVPVDSHAVLGYMLMMPLLLIVPAFSLAGLRLSWIALRGGGPWRGTIALIVIAASAANVAAMARFVSALLRIFVDGPA